MKYFTDSPFEKMMMQKPKQYAPPTNKGKLQKSENKCRGQIGNRNKKKDGK